jgi:para-nitrobenzyl esterase
LFASGDYNQVPVIVGTNRDEYKLFMMMNPDYVYNILDTIPLVLDHSDYELTAYYCSEAWKATMADGLSATLSVHQPESVYTYRFDWDEEPTILGFDVAFIIGAAHGMEIPFVFGDPDDSVVESREMFLYTSRNKPGRAALAGSMSSYWAALAYEGAPGTGMFQAPQDTEWTPWRNADDADRLMIFDTPESGGSVMSSYHVTLDDVRGQLQAETGFSGELKCELYGIIFGEDDYYLQACSE